MVNSHPIVLLACVDKRDSGTGGGGGTCRMGGKRRTGGKVDSGSPANPNVRNGTASWSGVLEGRQMETSRGLGRPALSRGFSGLLRQLSAPLVLGMGAHWTWAYCATILVDVLFFQGFSDPGRSNALFYIVSVAFYCATMGLYGIIAGRVREDLAGQCARIAVLAGPCAALGTLCLPFCESQTAAGSLLCVAAGAGTGLGSGLLYAACWGEAFSRRPVPAAVFNFTVSILLAVAATWAGTSLLPRAAVEAVTVGLPLLEGLCAARALGAHGSPGIREPIPPEKLAAGGPPYAPARLEGFALWVCLPLLFVGMSTGVLREFSLHPIMAEGTETLPALIASLALAFALISLAMIVLRDDSSLFARAALLALALSLAVILSPAAGERGVLNAALVSYICLDAMTWAAPCDLVRRYRIAPALAFGLGRMAVALGIGAGNGVIKLTVGAEAAYEASNTALPLAMIVLFFVAYGFWPQDRTVRRHVLKGEGPEEGGAQEDDAPTAPAAPADAPARQAPGEKDPRRGACSTLAGKHGLSQRELDVLVLLADGRDVPFVADALGISANTAKSHVQHIYQKLGVHTRQGLITLVADAAETARRGRAR